MTLIPFEPVLFELLITKAVARLYHEKVVQKVSSIFPRILTGGECPVSFLHCTKLNKVVNCRYKICTYYDNII